MAMTTTGKMMPPAMQRLIKGGDRSMTTVSDDNMLMKQVVGTHVPDGREVDVELLLHLVEDILKRTNLDADTVAAVGSPAQTENMEDKTNQASYSDVLDALSYIIDRVSCELNMKALNGGDAHATTLSIFKLLTPFSWDAKLVLTLASFANNYGEFWLLAQIYSSNQLAKSMAILKQLPMIMEHSGALKSLFDALDSLIQAMLKVTRCVVDLTELPSAYISSEVPALSAARDQVPTAVYWTIRSAVACASQITSLTSHGLEYITSTTEQWELSTLAHKLMNIYEHLREQITICSQHIEEKRLVEAYQTLLKLIETIHIDNMKILKALIYPKDDIQPLVEGTTKKRVSIEVLRRRNVLLLISGLDISQEELSILEQIHSESKLHATRQEMHQYELVWIPVVDRSVQWTDPTQKHFEALKSTMPWYTVNHPSLIHKAVIRLIKEKWHFRNKPILVVLDPQGRVVCPNAIHMMWIWGSNAFPFTTLREEALWKEETWRLELLVDGIDQTILNWIKEGKYIFLYGGDDIEWIRKFTVAARLVASAARIPLEMVYVGKSGKREQLRRVIETINLEKLSYTWQDLTMVWYFWTRLESMFFSKIQLGKTDEYDPVMQQIKRLLSFDKTGGWAVLGRGSSIMVSGHGTTVLPALLEYDAWKVHVATKGYDVALKEHHDKIQDVTHPCCRFEFQSTTGRIPESMRCPECKRLMEKLTTFVCCHDEVVPSIYE
ncbi:protein SIEVE ELEMENT OCCLUSION B-like isoform X3 [Syzygium oleosum]|uniref:protein SIEVE ELEMENT OCCLUSION B-like isoform X3 n=1 Tax=Syzygium oleosum TaxID=219896 RepID=UPI0024BB0389|nr:protein SIEVE ELEMENT OCCLUSION B-like isoform X3 [Syzygium oleosum]